MNWQCLKLWCPCIIIELKKSSKIWKKMMLKAVIIARRRWRSIVMWKDFLLLRILFHLQPSVWSTSLQPIATNWKNMDNHQIQPPPHPYSRKAKYKSLSEVRKKLQILLFQYVIFLWYYFLFMWNNWRYMNSVIKVKQKYNHGSGDLLDTLMYWLNLGEHYIKFFLNVQLLMYTRFKSVLRPIVRMLLIQTCLSRR